ncbi:TPA: hypothetical protein ACP32N_003160 [Pseudomonas aeruginosa]
MTRMPLPIYGAEIEAFGVLCSFIGADYMDTGEVFLTVRASASNARVIKEKAIVGGHVVLSISDQLVQLSRAHCLWRNSPGFDVTDEDGFVAYPVEKHVRAAAAVLKFQRAISRLNRL